MRLKSHGEGNGVHHQLGEAVMGALTWEKPGAATRNCCRVRRGDSQTLTATCHSDDVAEMHGE